MTKTVLAAGAAACFALGLAGCAEVEGLFSTNAATNATSEAQLATQAASLAKGATALVCQIANAANVAAQVEAAINAGQSVQGTDGKLYTASTIVCASLGGKVTGTGVVN